MSDAITATSSSPSPPATFFLQSLITKLGLGCSVAVALAVLVLLSSLLLASCLCFRRQNPSPRNPNPNGVVLSQFIFVDEDESDSDRVGVSSGLDPATVDSYPKFPYSASKGGDNVCPICLCEYEEGEMMRVMPDCKHCFHPVCIDAWLKLSGSCPVCRTSPMPTPLSEVVPLSRYSMDRRRR